MIDEHVICGPLDNSTIPLQSIGVLFYNELKIKDSNKIILIENDTGEEITYGQLLKLSVKLAIALKSLDFKENQTITIISENNSNFIVVLFAAFYIGAQVNVLNPDYTSDELTHFFNICPPNVLFCAEKTLKNTLEAKTDASVFLLDGELEDNRHIFNLMKTISDEEIRDFRPVDLNCDQVAMILSSSGTTGLPKAVMLTHANLRTTLLYAGDPKYMDLNEYGRTLLYLPFAHIFGILMILGVVYNETKSIIFKKFEPNQFLKAIQEYKITNVPAVPPILLFLVKNPLIAKYNLKSLKDIYCGTASISKDLENSVENRLNVTVRQMYGLTETSGPVTVLPKGIRKRGTVGIVNALHQIKICNSNGESLGANAVGELFIKGGGVMKGYCNNEKVTKQAMVDGFLKSGDLGYYDNEGYFYIVDRIKDIIKYKGFQVSPAELEGLLNKHPAVKDSGVVGIPDERAGEVPLAFVVKQNTDITAEDLIKYIEENISIQKRLYGGVRFVDQIPKTTSGKILRRKLKEMIY